MVEGLVSSIASRSPLRGTCGKKPAHWGRSSVGAPLLSYDARDVSMPIPVTSWRSGAGYVRHLSQNGVELPLSSNELIALFGTGDYGHQYKKLAYSAMHTNLVLGPRKSLMPVHPGSGGEVICSIYPKSISGISQYFDPTTTPSWVMTDSALKDWGQSAVIGYNPIQQGADLLVSLGELLQEGLPKPLAGIIALKGKKGRPELISAFAKEYLGYIFGIKPVIKDIRAILNVAQGIDKIVNQWIKDNNKQVRRRRQFPVKVTPAFEANKSGNLIGNTSIAAWWPTYFSDPSANLVSGDKPYKSTATTASISGTYLFSKESILKTKLSFSAAYEYRLENLLPGDDAIALSRMSDSQLGDLIRLHYLGISSGDVGLNLIWSISPWSWMIDWFTNIGSQFDFYRQMQSVGLQVDYAYAKVVQEYWTKISSSFYAPGSQVSSNLIARHDMEYKQLYVRRVKASPFGFNVDFGALTSAQLSTLAALAIARLPI